MDRANQAFWRKKHLSYMPMAGISLALLAGFWSDLLVAKLIIAAAICFLLVWNVRLQHRVERSRPDEPGAPSRSSVALSGSSSLDEHQDISHRLISAHPVSGLPLREALLAQMNADQAGMLGAIAFVDFDRLTAFDPALGERVFAALILRLRNMLPAGRFIAQVDRGHIGMWFGADMGEEEARAELDAIDYALGEFVQGEDGKPIIPQIKLRLARFDRSEGLEAHSFLARMLASFALAAGSKIEADEPIGDFDAHARQRYALEQDLRQAIVRRELSMAYQPLIDASQKRVCGAEALIRWQHSEQGAISPARFIPIVEAMGLASEIGLWALNTAVREAHGWAVQGLSHLRVAVNVSGLQLERDDLPVLVKRTLERHDLSPAALEIELTESVATSNAAHCRRIFQELRAMGVKLAVDDFGTGYSGFSSLRTLAFDKIKIDREFVANVDTRADCQAICQSIIALGRGLGIRVLAEGVERRTEYEWLRRHGCDHFQGFYFARPMKSEAFAAFASDPGLLSELLRLGAEPEKSIERVSA
jgi:EAL domain-containing protein (putative c-di-GMP-specific phosphodiesterase class I)